MQNNIENSLSSYALKSKIPKEENTKKKHQNLEVNFKETERELFTLQLLEG